MKKKTSKSKKCISKYLPPDIAGIVCQYKRRCKSQRGESYICTTCQSRKRGKAPYDFNLLLSSYDVVLPVNVNNLSDDQVDELIMEVADIAYGDNHVERIHSVKRYSPKFCSIQCRRKTDIWLWAC